MTIPTRPDVARGYCDDCEQDVYLFEGVEYVTETDRPHLCALYTDEEEPDPDYYEPDPDDLYELLRDTRDV